MITNEQVEAALKAWYDAGDAGNFASMFAALKAADLEAAARVAELKAALKPLAEMDCWITAEHDHDDSIEECNGITVAEIRAARAAMEKKNDSP